MFNEWIAYLSASPMPLLPTRIVGMIFSNPPSSRLSGNTVLLFSTAMVKKYLKHMIMEQAGMELSNKKNNLLALMFIELCTPIFLTKYLKIMEQFYYCDSTQ